MENRHKVDTNRWGFSFVVALPLRENMFWMNKCDTGTTSKNGRWKTFFLTHSCVNVNGRMRVYENKCKTKRKKIMQKVFIAFNYASLPDMFSQWRNPLVLHSRYFSFIYYMLRVKLHSALLIIFIKSYSIIRWGK